MLKVLTQYQEATADPRVVPLMQRYFAYQLRELPNRPLRDWGKYRWQDEVASLVWLYNRFGDPDLLRLAQVLHQQGYDWHAQFENFAYTSKMTAKDLGLHEGTRFPDRAMQTHGVNNAMALKSSALWWLISNDPSFRPESISNLLRWTHIMAFQTECSVPMNTLRGKIPRKELSCARWSKTCFRLSVPWPY